MPRCHELCLKVVERMLVCRSEDYPRVDRSLFQSEEAAHEARIMDDFMDIDPYDSVDPDFDRFLLFTQSTMHEMQPADNCPYDNTMEENIDPCWTTFDNSEASSGANEDLDCFNFSDGGLSNPSDTSNQTEFDMDAR